MKESYNLNTSKQYGIFIIGMGGIGSWLIEPLMRFVGNKAEYILIDGDKFEDSNFSRQSCHPKLVNMNKAAATAIKMRSYFNYSIVEVPEYIGDDKATELLLTNSYKKGNIYISCVDNNGARMHLVNIACHLGIIITAGNELTDGNVHIGTRELISVHPEIWESDDGDRSTMSCQDIANIPGGEQIIVTNFMAAAHVMQHMYHLMNSEELPDVRETYFDIKKSTTNAILENGGCR